MIRALRWAVLAVGLGIVVPLLAADDKKPDPKKPERVTWTGEISGKVTSFNASGLALEVEIKTLEANNALSRLNYNRGRGRPQMNRPQVKVVTHKVDIDFDLAENVKVRTATLAEQFDAKGKPKKMTRSELDALKGDKRLPGYEADQSALNVGDIVTVYFKPAPVKKSKEKDKDAADKPDPEAVMVLILQDNDTSQRGDKKKK